MVAIKIIIFAAYFTCCCTQFIGHKRKTSTFFGYTGDEAVPGGPRGIVKWGGFNLKVQCPNNRYNYGIGYGNAFNTKQCGGKRTRKAACLRFGCCWIPQNAALYLPVCVNAAYYILNYKVGESWGEWSSWGNCRGYKSCTGIQSRYRTCDGVPRTGNCPGNDEEKRSCGMYGCVVKKSWGTWGSWSDTCTVTEPTCFSGQKTRKRYCLTQYQLVAANRDCNGSPSETVACDTSLCLSATDWVDGSCSATCGSGTYPTTRTCTNGASGGPAECWAIATTCTSLPACGDPSIDLVILMDASSHVDGCTGKQFTFGHGTPFYSSYSFLTSTNFPVFFQEKAVVSAVLNGWDNVGQSGTRVALHGISANCNYPNNKNFHVVNYLNTDLTTTMIDAMPLVCGPIKLYHSLRCVSNGHFNSDNGDSSTNDNYILMMIPQISTVLGFETTFLDSELILSAIKAKYFPATKILILSTYDISSLSQAEQILEIERYNKLGCLSSTTGTCQSYVGTIWDDTSTILDNIRAIVTSASAT